MPGAGQGQAAFPGHAGESGRTGGGASRRVALPPTLPCRKDSHAEGGTGAGPSGIFKPRTRAGARRQMPGRRALAPRLRSKPRTPEEDGVSRTQVIAGEHLKTNFPNAENPWYAANIVKDLKSPGSYRH